MYEIPQNFVESNSENSENSITDVENYSSSDDTNLEFRIRDVVINKTKLKLDEYLFAFIKNIRSEPNFENEIATIALDPGSCKIFWNKLLDYPYINKPEKNDKFAFMVLLLMSQQEIEQHRNYDNIDLDDYFDYYDNHEECDSNCICSQPITYRFQIEHKNNGNRAWLGCKCICKSEIVSNEKQKIIKQQAKEMSELKKKEQIFKKCEKCNEYKIHNRNTLTHCVFCPPFKYKCNLCNKYFEVGEQILDNKSKICNDNKCKKEYEKKIQEELRIAIENKKNAIINQHLQDENFIMDFFHGHNYKKITDFTENDKFTIKQIYCEDGKYGLEYKLKIVLNNHIEYIYSNYCIKQIINNNINNLKRIKHSTFIINEIYKNNKGYFVGKIKFDK